MIPHELKEHYRVHRTSSGTSAHTILSVAAENAKRELIERDALFRFWKGETSFQLFELRIIEQDRSSNYVSIQEELQRFGYHLKHFEVPKDGNYRVVISVIVNNKNSYPYIFVSSAGALSETAAIELSTVEVFRLFWMNFSWIQSGHSIDCAGPDQAAFYYHPESGKRLLEFLSACSKRPATNAAKIDGSKVESSVSFYCISDLIEEGLPPVVRAVSTDAEPMFFGPSEPRRRPSIELEFHPF